jgi:hypothetical protein
MMRTRFHGAVWIVALLLLAGGVLLADPTLPEGVKATALGERIEHYDFHSAALNRAMAFVIVQPREYRAGEGKQWPVLFFLHGLGRKETTLI